MLGSRSSCQLLWCCAVGYYAVVLPQIQVFPPVLLNIQDIVELPKASGTVSGTVTFTL